MTENVTFYLDEHADQFPGVDGGADERPRLSVGPRPHDPERRPHARLPRRRSTKRAARSDPQFKGYGLSDLVGRSGLELEYEKYLRGTRRAEVHRERRRRTIRTLGEEPATPGDDLVLALDAEIQQAAEEELDAGIQRARTRWTSSRAPT